MTQMVGAMARCFFADLGDCEGRLQKAHLIPKQRIRREFKGELDPEQLAKLVWHPTCWRPMCVRHHAMFDNHQIVLARDQVPEDVERYAEMWNLQWSLDSDFGRP